MPLVARPLHHLILRALLRGVRKDDQSARRSALLSLPSATRRLAAPLLSTMVAVRPDPSAPRRGRGDLGEQRQNMQLAVEIELFRLALSVADAVPELANLLDPEGAGSTSRAYLTIQS